MKALQDAGRLLRVFTQNVDCLERCAGVNPDLLVEAHGTFAGAKCIERECAKVADVVSVRKTMDAGKVPRCAECGGIVKPDIVFFGEALPKRFFERMNEDSAQADLILIIGTSLKVFPFAGLAGVVREQCPRVLINNEQVGDFTLYPGPEAAKPILYRDVFLSGDAQQTVKALAAKLGLGKTIEAAYAAGVQALKPNSKVPSPAPTPQGKTGVRSLPSRALSQPPKKTSVQVSAEAKGKLGDKTAEQKPAPEPTPSTSTKPGLAGTKQPAPNLPSLGTNGVTKPPMATTTASAKPKRAASIPRCPLNRRLR
jgi:NAD-dependent histone deacetylase SIR2